MSNPWQITQGLREPRPEKWDLQQGIRQWVADQTGIPNVGFTNLMQASHDDLMLLAMAMGYKPPQWAEDRLRSAFAERARLHETARLEREAREAIQQGRPIFLHDDSES